MMKKVTRDVFIGAPDWAESFAVDADGRAWYYACPVSSLRRVAYCWLQARGRVNIERAIGEFDWSDWQNSAIDREVIK